MNCPFCNSDIKPSPGLPGVYQHAENVETCIIGDLAIEDLAAWNRRPLPSEGRRLGLEEAAKVVRAIGLDWGVDGQYQKEAAAEYLESAIRALISKE